MHAEFGNLSATAGDLDAASRHYRSALDVIEHTRSELLDTSYRLSFLTRLIRFYERYIDVLVERREFDEALTVADSIRARVLAERHGVAAPARPSASVFRRAALALRSALLFYWVGSTRAYAWVVTGDRIRFIPLETNAREIETLVDQYRNTIVTSLGDPLASNAAAGDTLFQRLVQSRRRLDTARRARRHRPRRRVEYAQLRNAAGARRAAPLLDRGRRGCRCAFARHAERDGRHRRKAEGRSVLLIGDPVPADPKFPSLRYASAEMMAVSGAFADRAAVYRADQATPAQYLASKPAEFGIVHFTAHAEANAESPLDSAVILSRDEGGLQALCA